MQLLSFLKLCVSQVQLLCCDSVEHSLLMSNLSDLICVGPDVNKLKFNVVEADDNVGNIKGFHASNNKKKIFASCCQLLYSL